MRTDKRSPVIKEFLLEGKWLRVVEMAAIGLLLAAAPVLVLVSSIGAGDTQVSADDPGINAQAYAMPNDGWAPLTVYFSALGSSSLNGDITRYEWDLDGNGAFETDATANGGYASYTYSKPRDYVISLRVTDANGGTAVASTVVSVRHPASSSVDYWTVFDDSRVRRIDVSLDQTDWNQMWADVESKYQAKADAVVFGEELDDVGFRMRGQFSLRMSGDKKPWKIDTDAYIADQEYHNLRQLMLLNNIGDPSLLKEKLAYEMMRFAGLPASHVSFVELWIDIRDDGQDPIYWGVYSMVERVDNKYIGNRFGQDAKGGNLYKASHAQRGPMDLVYYGDRIEDYPVQNGQYPYGKMNNEEEADYSDIVALCKVVDGTEYESDQELIQTLESSLDVDAFLRYLAVNTIIDNWDSYIYTGNNFYLFNNSVSGRFEWIPWDLTWGEGVEAPLFTRSESGLMEGAPLYDLAFSVEKYQDAYRAYLDLLMRYWFTPQNLTPMIKQYHTMIAPYIDQSTGDKAFYGVEPMFPPEAFRTSGDDLGNFVSMRSEYIQSAIE
jgi:PKD repeat protein